MLFRLQACSMNSQKETESSLGFMSYEFSMRVPPHVHSCNGNQETQQSYYNLHQGCENQRELRDTLKHSQWLYILHSKKAKKKKKLAPICINTRLKTQYQDGGGLVAQSYPTLCNPTDCSPPSSSVHGIFQARTLEWDAISFSRAISGGANNKVPTATETQSSPHTAINT